MTWVSKILSVLVTALLVAMLVIGLAATATGNAWIFAFALAAGSGAVLSFQHKRRVLGVGLLGGCALVMLVVITRFE